MAIDVASTDPQDPIDQWEEDNESAILGNTFSDESEEESEESKSEPEVES